jgi:[acyl-carrier-protein] S-malonyltransferase
VELTPAKALTGIAKRELPGIELVAVRTPDDLAAAQALLDRHREHVNGDQPGAVREVAMPAQGIFTRVQGLAEGAAVVAGSRIGTVRTNRDEFAIVAPASGSLTEWLRHDGDIVGAGLPVARLSRRQR